MNQPWDDPDHNIVEDLKEFKRKWVEEPYKAQLPLVNRRDAEVLIANGWVEGRDFEVYG